MIDRPPTKCTSSIAGFQISRVKTGSWNPVGKTDSLGCRKRYVANGEFVGSVRAGSFPRRESDAGAHIHAADAERVRHLGVGRVTLVAVALFIGAEEHRIPRYGQRETLSETVGCTQFDPMGGVRTEPKVVPARYRAVRGYGHRRSGPIVIGQRYGQAAYRVSRSQVGLFVARRGEVDRTPCRQREAARFHAQRRLDAGSGVVEAAPDVAAHQVAAENDPDAAAFFCRCGCRRGSCRCIIPVVDIFRSLLARFPRRKVYLRSAGNPSVLKSTIKFFLIELVVFFMIVNFTGMLPQPLSPYLRDGLCERLFGSYRFQSKRISALS